VSVLSTEHTSARHITAVKFVIAGGFGVGKTTFVGAISEVEPLTTEAAMTTVASGVDNHSAVASTAKTTTTVAMDFGRLTVDETLVMYLFGAPGQERFTFMWDDLISGALGAVVLVDTRRVEDCFAAVDYFEKKGLPFVVGVNNFDDSERYPVDDVREALCISSGVPVFDMDARDKASCRDALLTLLELLVTNMMSKRTAAK
jgi:signal recognition particle receptor subunit beta